MRSDLRNILHPSDSSPSSSSLPASAINTTTTSTTASALPPTNSTSVSTSPSSPPRHFSASVSTNPFPVATHSSASPQTSFAVSHYSIHAHAHAHSRPEPPRLNHRRPSPAEHCAPSSSNSRTAFNHSSSLSSILQDPADLTTSVPRNPFQPPANSSSSTTRCPSTSASRDSSGIPPNLHPNSDHSTTCSTSTANGKSSAQPTSAPTTPPSPSPSPIQQSGFGKSPAPNYQSTATQTSFDFSMHSSPQPQVQEHPTSSHAGTHFPVDHTHQIYPSPHAEPEPSSGQQSPSHPSSRSNTMHPVDRSSSLSLDSVEVVTPGAHIPQAASTDSRITDVTSPDVSDPSGDQPCEMCIAQFQAHRDQLQRPRDPPPNMAESQRKMGEFSELVRTMKMGCERHRHQRAGSPARDAGDEGSQARKRKEPTEAITGTERHLKAARFSSGSPPSEPPSIRGTNGPSQTTSFDTGFLLRRPNHSAFPHFIGQDIATILDMPGAAHRQYEPPRKDWQNMWQDVENDRKKEKKNRKDSVPVLPPAGDGVEVAPQ